MINKVTIDGLFNKPKIELIMKNELYLLTGDNGSGKTTLLNIIYNVLTSEFSGLFNIKFKQVEIFFDENVRNLKSIIVSKEKSKIYIKYITDELLDLVAEKHPFSDNFDLNYNSRDSEYYYEDDDDDFFWGKNTSSVRNLIHKHPELSFIQELKESVLYFPTFRRIESDLKMLRQSTSLNYDDQINIDFKDSRILMGVNNNEIMSIYKSYSDKIRKFNSEGLNELLKKFIRNLISNIDNEKKQAGGKPNITDYNAAVKNLIELANKLEIDDGLNEEGIKNYFIEYEAKVKNVTELKENREVKKVKVTNGKKKNSKTLEISEMVNLLVKISEIENKNVYLIFELISLYGEHLNEQELVLKPVKYLKTAIKSFFKDKLELEFDEKNYSLNLSTDFDNLSTGEKQLITLLSFISIIMIDTVFKPLVIIDEPELSLHISWQKNLLPNLLKLPGITYLMATHSPYIANINYIDSVKKLGEIDEFK